MKTSDDCEDQLARLSWAMDVPAPVDRDGNVVPLTTRTLYDGNGREVEVAEIALVDSILRGRLVWRVRTNSGISLELNLLSLERPDSWERLEEDARKAPRDYIEARGIIAERDRRVATMTSDIVRRAKALAGVSE